MDTKLTLKMDIEVIRQAKGFAEQRGVSLSRLVEDWPAEGSRQRLDLGRRLNLARRLNDPKTPPYASASTSAASSTCLQPSVAQTYWVPAFLVTFSRR